MTLFTYAFLHADWLHLGSNMLFLWVFGDNIEDALGHVKFAVFYLLCAAISGLVYIVFALGTYTWLIGASGAVAGVMGAYYRALPACPGLRAGQDRHPHPAAHSGAVDARRVGRAAGVLPRHRGF